MTAIHWFTRDGNDTMLFAVTSEEPLDACVRYGIYPLQKSRNFIVAGDMTRRALLWEV